MAVADITQSLLEDRPYRKGLSLPKVKEILVHNVQAGRIDPVLTELALDNLADIAALA
ncbi:MAG: hypothetical protein GX335_10060 [Firmicutes bacterium]|nr:hypothetical protein [Bacillota bacterium]